MLNQFSILDLTHTLTENSPNWKLGCGFRKHRKDDYVQNGFRTDEFHLPAGIGTHLDSPSHVIQGGQDIDQMPLESFCVPICVLDLHHLEPDAQIGWQEIETYEEHFGSIPEKALIVANTGWSRFWNEPQKYRNPDKFGKMHFPTFSGEIIPFLLERNVAGIGIDTLSPDADGSDFIIHRELLGNEKYILENLTNLHRLPKKGATFFGPPLKIAGATESPVRAVAFVPK